MGQPKAWKNVWITGASSGIGHALARLMDGRAQTVAISARSGDRLAELAGACAHVRAFPLDVTDAQASAETVAAVEAAGGPIDLAVLNAGTWTFMSVEDFDLAAVRRGVEVNQMGVMNALAALLPRMLERGSGHIVIVASVAGYRGLPRSIAYGPTKAALNSVAETLKTELEPRGISVSVVNPGFVDTPMTRSNPFPMPGLVSADTAAEKILEGIARGRYEIAFPRGFAFQMRLLRALPVSLYFWLIRRFVMKG